MNVKLKCETMLVISFQEFEAHPRHYLDQADEGVEILLQRDEHKSYRLSPVASPLADVDASYVLAPDEDLARAITADELRSKVKNGLREIFQQQRQ